MADKKRSSWRVSLKKLPSLREVANRFSGQEDSLSNDIVRYRGISLQLVQQVWNDVLQNEAAQGVQLYVALENLNDDVDAGRTVQFISRAGMNSDDEFLCRAPFSKGRIAVHESQVRPKPREEWTIEDMCEFVVLPATLPDDAFFSDTVGPAAFGTPFKGHFVSQARSTPMATLVDALAAHFAGQPADKTFVWIDIFCANQPLLTRKDRGLADGVQTERWTLLNSGLHEAIKRFEGTLILFDSWQDPTPLKRAWCIWELYGAANSGNNLRIVFAGSEAASVEQWLREYDGSFLKVLADMDPRKMQCHVPEDLAMITTAVEAMDGGFSSLKQMVTERLAHWLLRAVEDCVKAAAERKHNEDFADLLHNAGMVLKDIGELEVALSYYHKALAIRKGTLGERHSSVADTLRMIGVVYKAQGKLDLALKTYEDALAIYKETPGERHSSVAQTLNNMAVVYKAQGKLDLALKTYEEALTIFKNTLGERHSSVAATLNNMAGVYRAKDKLDLALETYEAALAITKETLGERHSSVAQTLKNMAIVYKAQGKLDLALVTYEEALAITKETLGERHSSVAETLMGMAIVYEAQGNLDLALETYEEALAIKKETVGERHSSVGGTLNNMAGVYATQGKLDLALEKFEDALAIKKETLGERHSSVAATLNNMAIVYQAQGKRDLALETYEAALAIYKETQGERHSSVAATLNNIASLYESQGKLDLALKTYEEALAIKKDALGPRHPSVATTLGNMAGVYEAQGKLDLALKTYEQALGIYTDVYERGHSETVNCARLVQRLKAAM